MAGKKGSNQRWGYRLRNGEKVPGTKAGKKNGHGFHTATRAEPTTCPPNAGSTETRFVDGGCATHGTAHRTHHHPHPKGTSPMGNRKCARCQWRNALPRPHNNRYLCEICKHIIQRRQYVD